MVWIDGRYWWIIFLRNCWDDLNSIPTQYQPPGLKAVQIRFHTKLPAKIEPIWDEITPKRFPWESFSSNVLYRASPIRGGTWCPNFRSELYTAAIQTSKVFTFFAIRTNTLYNLDKYIFQFAQIHYEIWTNIFRNLDKYIWQFGQIKFINFNKYILKHGKYIWGFE